MSEQRERQADGGVGYGRPPKHSRFKPGQSGNPKGRPKGRKNVASIFEETLYRAVPITENGRRRRVPAIEAMFLGLLRKSLDGDLRAFDKFAKLMPMLLAATTVQAGATEGNPEADPADDAELLAGFEEMIRESLILNDKERDNEH